MTKRKKLHGKWTPYKRTIRHYKDKSVVVYMPTKYKKRKKQ